MNAFKHARCSVKDTLQLCGNVKDRRRQCDTLLLLGFRSVKLLFAIQFIIHQLGCVSVNAFILGFRMSQQGAKPAGDYQGNTADIVTLVKRETFPPRVTRI